MSGLVDIQVNGYRGVDFSSASLTLDAISRATSDLAAEGTGAYLATVITSPMTAYEHVLPLLADAMETEACAGRLVGIHLEGPFISPEAGARGAHPAAHVQAPSIDVLERLVDLARGAMRIVTLAPEREGAPETIEWAVARGIVVAVGHTLADATAVRDAADAGATLSTHLGNGLPWQIDRHSNPIWPQLAEPRLKAMLITDGHHIPPELIQTVLLAKGIDNVIVTSDAAPIAGCAPGVYDFAGTSVRLSADGCIRCLDADGYLAGSGSTLLQCLNHLASVTQLGEADLWRVSRDNPARLLGLPPESIPDAGVSPPSATPGKDWKTTPIHP